MSSIVTPERPRTELEQRPLRICLGVPYIAPAVVNSGIAWYNRWLADGLRLRGHQVDILDVSFQTARFVPKGIQRAIYARSFLRAAEYDIFETSNWPGLAALHDRSKVGASVVRLITPPGRSWRTVISGRLEAASIRRADALIASTDYIAGALGVDHSYRVPFGIPDVPQSAPKGAGPIRFVAIGRGERRKGTDVLFKALTIVADAGADCAVTLVGSCDEYAASSPELTALWGSVRERYGDRLTVLRSIPEEEKNALLAASDYLLMTSRSESFGLPVIEAMRAGTAVISSSGGGLKEVAGACSANRLYADPESERELAREMLAAIAIGKDRAAASGAMAREAYAARFTEDAFVDETVAVYRDVLARRRGSG